jgi:enoyl-CoA hydratase
MSVTDPLQPEPVVTQRRDGTDWITLNRPELGNTLSPPVLDGIHAALDAAADPDVHAVVLAAEGEIFCAGADLKHLLATGGRPAESGFLLQVGDLFDRLDGFPKPIVGAIQGLAVAGGLELLLCCDFVVAADTARFGDAHAIYGLLPGAGGSVRLPRRVGEGTAKWLMFTGSIVSATELVHTDLLARVVARDELQDEVDRVVSRMAGSSRRGLRDMKRLVTDGLQQPLAAALRAERAACAAHEHTADFAEGLDAFQQGRRPNFTDH